MYFVYTKKKILMPSIALTDSNKKATIFIESVDAIILMNDYVIIEFCLNYISFTSDKSMRRECQTKLTLLTHFETPN